MALLPCVCVAGPAYPLKADTRSSNGPYQEAPCRFASSVWAQAWLVIQFVADPGYVVSVVAAILAASAWAPPSAVQFVR